MVSLNVKGVGHVVKRQKTISFLKRENAQITLLQETHLTDLEHIKLRRSWVGQVFYSSFNSHSRGVAILVHKKLPFTLDEVIKDDEGRFVIISGFLDGERILIGSAYGPNMFEPSFFSRLLAATSSHLTPSQYLEETLTVFRMLVLTNLHQSLLLPQKRRQGWRSYVQIWVSLMFGWL